MKIKKRLAAGLVMSLSSATLISALGADLEQPRTLDRNGRPDASLKTPNHAVFDARDLGKARDLVGMNIKNDQNETIGEIRDLVVDLPSGRVLYAVLSSSTFFGGKLATVPPNVFSRSADEKYLTWNVSKDILNGAPTFDTAQWPDLSDRSYGQRVYGYYGQTPYWSEHSGNLNRNRADQPIDTAKSNDRAIRDNLKAMGKFHKASDVLGMKVENSQNENLGDIQDLLVDLHSGRIVYAVLASGGFLGIGEKYLAVPPAEFHTATDGKHLALDVDKEKLKGAPSFDKNNWPQTADQTWTRNVYSYYGHQPYWDSTGSATQESNRNYSRNQADNTRQNVRDRGNNTLTPPDQGASETDRSLTQQIRQAITKDDSFSTYAKNIKIMTVNGTVTLRGVVNSQSEKDQLEAKAKQVAGVSQINNQLEIKQ